MTLLASVLWYFFSFPNKSSLTYDSTIGPLLGSSTGPLWVFDLRQGGGIELPGYWTCLVLPASYLSSLKTHPNLQFIMSPQDGIIVRNLDHATVLNIVVNESENGSRLIGLKGWVNVPQGV